MPPESALQKEVKDSQEFSMDDFSLEDEEETKEEATEEESDEVVVEDEEESEPDDKVTISKADLDDLKSQITSLQKEILGLSRKPTSEDAIKSKAKDSDTLTPEQISALIEKHQGDPGVLTNIITYVAEQKAREIANEIKDTTVADIAKQNQYSQIAGMANRILQEDSDGYLKANPEVRGKLKEFAANLGLQDAPAGELAAYAIYRYAEAVKNPVKKEEGAKKETRVLDKTRPKPEKSKTHGLTQEQIEVAKKFGVRPETYALFVQRK